MIDQCEICGDMKTVEAIPTTTYSMDRMEPPTPDILIACMECLREREEAEKAADEDAYQQYLEEAELEYMDEGPLCPSCDGTVAANAITCPCGAVLDDEAFWVDPMPGATIEERMAFESMLECREQGW